MHNDINQPNGKPTNGAALPGAAAKQQAGGAPVASRATAPGATRAASPSLVTPPKLQAAPPAAAPPAAKSPPPGSAADNSAKAPIKPQAEQPTPATGTNVKYTAGPPGKPRRKPRPYFFPDDLPRESLPRGVRVAHDKIVGPVYEQYVLRAQDALAKAFGAVFAAETSLGIVAQHQAVGASLSGTASEPEVELALSRHHKSAMRLVALGNMLLRLKASPTPKGLMG
jgi:hypothetical protein